MEEEEVEGRKGGGDKERSEDEDLTPPSGPL